MKINRIYALARRLCVWDPAAGVGQHHAVDLQGAGSHTHSPPIEQLLHQCKSRPALA